MKTNDERLLALIERAYEAASDAARWPGLLLELSSALECELVALDFQDRDARVARVQHHVGPQDASLQREYEEYYAARNVFLHARPDLTFSGAIRNGEAIVPDRDALKSEYFNDFLRRVGVLHAVGMVPLREGPVMALLSLMRRIGAPSFTDADLALLGRFMPHLQRATSIQRRAPHPVASRRRREGSCASRARPAGNPSHSRSPPCGSRHSSWAGGPPPSCS